MPPQFIFLNQLRDYEIAIERPPQTLKENLSLDDLQAKFNTLNLELRDRGLIVMTMRADFYDRAATYPNVAKVITHHQKLVKRMNEMELFLRVDYFIFTLAGRLLLLGVAALIWGWMASACGVVSRWPCGA